MSRSVAATYVINEPGRPGGGIVMSTGWGHKLPITELHIHRRSRKARVFWQRPAVGAGQAQVHSGSHMEAAR